MFTLVYCPVDGIEWREGITRCPEHDVDLVDEPPEVEDETSPIGGFGAERATRVAVGVIVVASILYAVSGVLLWGWVALVASRDEPLTESVFLELLEFVQPAALSVGLGALGCLVAGVLGRVWTRLGEAAPTDAPLVEDEEEEELPAEGAASWVFALLSSLTIVFVVVWAVTGIAIAWDDAAQAVGVGIAFPGDEGGPSESFVNLSALHNAAYNCGLGALVAMGALLMERTYYRMRGAG